ncbi:TIGR02444 family protein [Mesorhizobium sp. B2-4-19]|uniref:TIGR02444 family protein n=1 Tax=Mesorhizobium sp. B2-4-19 TaxID=2589930 RepID=UPI0011299D65|nr:TIGR02444 family protein [Mesorhizobium sp. B2-4-19]TPK60104.1 TIGR02444 family protein [Mesorhizobium sp. B2-4-19]
MSDRPSSAQAAWAFMLDFYRRQRVPEACLVLQDEAGVDVVEMLMLVHADITLGKRLSGGEIKALRAGTAGWREDAVLPLRAIRRKLKAARQDTAESAKEQLRTEIKKAELQAERLQVDFIARWLENAAGGGPALEATLSGLVPARSRNGAVESALANILAAAEAARLASTQPPAAP